MPPPATRLTQKHVNALTCPAGQGEVIHWDATLPGFGLRLYASGKRVWIAQYRDPTGRTRRLTLGDARVVKLDEAREDARQKLARAELGEDPQGDRQAARRALRVGQMLEAYLAASRQRLRPRSLTETERHLLKHAAPLHQEPAEGVGRADIVRVLTALGRQSGPVAANRVRASLSAAWTWALRSGLIEGSNPVAYTPKLAEDAPRARVLSDGDIALLWQAADGGEDYDRIVRLLLLTGARREEVAAMTWQEIAPAADGSALWTLPAERSKNHLPHEVWLAPLAFAQLPPRRDRAFIFGAGAGGFSGFSRCKLRLDKRMQGLLGEGTLAPWVLHDLRRTFATWAHENGVEPHIVEACLNHVSGAARRGVAGVYNKAHYREPKRIAFARWADHVAQVVGEPLPSNVVRLGVA
jgi:integrase